jgi:predicted permease
MTWRPFRRRRSRDQWLDDELRYHVERQYDDYVREGLSPAEARRRVGVEFGPVALAKDECRDVRPLPWLETTARDVRLSLRALARERLFTLSVILIFTIGIGSTVAMFSVLNGVVLRPLPYTQPHELAVIATHRMLQNQFDGTSGANFVDWRRQSRSFARMALYRRTSASQVVFAGADAPQRAPEGLVDADFFGLLGGTALIGRTFSPDESARGDPVVVLSEGLWREQFGGSVDAIGRRMLVAGAPHTIVGVMPRSFQLPTKETRLWRPLAVMPRWPAQLTIRDGDQFEALGRLQPGVRLDEAQAEMRLIARRLREQHDVNRNLDIRVTPLFNHVVGESTRRGIYLGFAAVLSLLAIAGANAGGLLAARATRRRGELAIRAALGASRVRLVRQLIAEHLTLWLTASTAGFIVAAILLQLLESSDLTGLPRLEDVDLDTTSAAIALLGGLVVVMTAGSVPALAASRADASDTLRTREAGAPSRYRLQRVLVTAQIAGATLLAIMAGLLVQSFVRVQHQSPGYPADSLLIARIDRPTSPRFFFEARERFAALPGVVAVGGITDFFIRRAGDQQITIEGRAFADANGRLPKFVMDSVTPGYFRAMDITIVEGRDFDDRDLESGAAPAVIVSRAVAERFWPGESAIGKRLVGGTAPPADGRWGTVVGVVEDLRREGLDVSPVLASYIPAVLRSMDLTIRIDGDAEALAPAIRRELRALDPSLPVPTVVTAGQRLGQQLGIRRFQTQALVFFAGVALAFAAAGLYAALTYQVTLRRREIGIRTALGAGRRDIVGLFVRGGAALTLAGTAIGIAGAILTAQVVRSLLYETAPLDLRSYLAAAAAVTVVSMMAAAVPARRASRVDPLIILREG